MSRALIRTVPEPSTRSRFIHIDSRDRSRVLYPQTNDYLVTLPDALYGVTRVQLVSAEIPKAEYFLGTNDNDTLELIFDPSIHASLSPTGTTGWPALHVVSDYDGTTRYALFRVDVSGKAYGHVYFYTLSDSSTPSSPATFNASPTTYLASTVLSRRTSTSSDSVSLVAYSEPDTDSRASCRVVIADPTTGGVSFGSEFGFDPAVPVYAKHVASLGDGMRAVIAYAAATTTSGTTTSSVRAIVASTGVDPTDAALRNTNATAYSLASDTVVAHRVCELPDDRILVVHKTATYALKAVVVSVSTGFAVTAHVPPTTIAAASAHLGDFDACAHGERVVIAWTTSAARISVALARIVASTAIVVYASTTLAYEVDDIVRVRFLSDAVATLSLVAHVASDTIVLRDAVTGEDFPALACVQGERYRFTVRPAAAGDAVVYATSCFALFTSATGSTAYSEGVSGLGTDAVLLVVTSSTPRTLYYGTTTAAATAAVTASPSTARGVITATLPARSTTSTSLDFGIVFVGAHDPGNVAYAWGTSAAHGDTLRSTRRGHHHLGAPVVGAAHAATPAVAAPSARVVVLDAAVGGGVWLGGSRGAWTRVPTHGLVSARTGAVAWFHPDTAGVYVYGGVQSDGGDADLPVVFAACSMQRVGSNLIVADVRNFAVPTEAARTTYDPTTTLAHKYALVLEKTTTPPSTTTVFEGWSVRMGTTHWSAPVQQLDASLFPDRSVTYGVRVPANVARTFRYTHPHPVAGSASAPCVHVFDVLVAIRQDAILCSDGSEATSATIVLRASVDGFATVHAAHTHRVAIGASEWVRLSVAITVPLDTPSFATLGVEFEIEAVRFVAVTVGLRDPALFPERILVPLAESVSYVASLTYYDANDEAETPVAGLVQEVARLAFSTPAAFATTDAPASYHGGVDLLHLDPDIVDYACVLRGDADIRLGDALAWVDASAVAGGFVQQPSGNAVAHSGAVLSPGFDGEVGASIAVAGAGCARVTGDDVVPLLRAVGTGAFDVACYVRLDRGADLLVPNLGDGGLEDSVSGAAPTVMTVGTSTSQVPGSLSGAVASMQLQDDASLAYAPVAALDAHLGVAGAGVHVGFFILVLLSNLAAATTDRPIVTIGSVSVELVAGTGRIRVQANGATVETPAGVSTGVWQHVFVDVLPEMVRVSLGGVAVVEHVPVMPVVLPITPTSVAWGGGAASAPRASVALPVVSSSAEARGAHALGIVAGTRQVIWSLPVATGGHLAVGFDAQRRLVATFGTAELVQQTTSNIVEADASTWHRVVLRRSSAGAVQLVLDGEVVASSSSLASAFSLALLSSSELTIGANAVGGMTYAQALAGAVDELAVLPRGRSAADLPVLKRKQTWTPDVPVTLADPGNVFNHGLVPRAHAAGSVDENGGMWLYGGEGDAGTCADVWLLVRAGDGVAAYNMLEAAPPAGNAAPDPEGEMPGSRQYHGMCADGGVDGSDAGGGQSIYVYGGLAQQPVGPFFVYGTFAEAEGTNALGAPVSLPTVPGDVTGFIYPVYTSQLAVRLDHPDAEVVRIAVAAAETVYVYLATTSEAWATGPRVAAPDEAATGIVELSPAVHLDDTRETRASTTAALLGDVWAYGVSTGVWERLYASTGADAQAPSARAKAHVWHHGGRLIVHGGVDAEGVEVQDASVYEFDLTARAWTRRTPSSSSSPSAPVYGEPAAGGGDWAYARSVTPGAAALGIAYSTSEVTNDDATSLRPALYAHGATFVNQLEGAIEETNAHYAVAVRGSATFPDDGYSEPVLVVDSQRHTVAAEAVASAESLVVATLPSVDAGAMLVLTGADSSASTATLRAVQLSTARATADALAVAAVTTAGIDAVVARVEEDAGGVASLSLAAAPASAALVLVPGVTRLRIQLDDASMRGYSVRVASGEGVVLAAPHIETSSILPGFTGSYVDIVSAPTGETVLSVMLEATTASTTPDGAAFTVDVYTQAQLNELLPSAALLASVFELHELATPALLATLLPSSVSARSVQMAVTDGGASRAVVCLVFQDNDDARRGTVAHIVADFSNAVLTATTTAATFATNAPTHTMAVCAHARDGPAGGAIIAHATDELVVRHVTATTVLSDASLTSTSVSGIGAVTLRALDWHTAATSTRGVWVSVFTYQGVGRVLPQRTIEDGTVVQNLIGETLHFTATPVTLVTGWSGGEHTVTVVRCAAYEGGPLKRDAVVVYAGGASSDLRYGDLASATHDPAVSASAVLEPRTSTFSLIQDVTLISTGVHDARVFTLTTVAEGKSAFVAVYVPLDRLSIWARFYEWSNGTYSAANPVQLVGSGVRDVMLDDAVRLSSTHALVTYVSGASTLLASTFSLTSIASGASGVVATVSVAPDNTAPIVDAVLRTHAPSGTQAERRLLGIVTHVSSTKEVGIVVRRALGVTDQAFLSTGAMSSSATRTSQTARMAEGDYALIGDFVDELTLRLRELDTNFTASYNTATTKITLRNAHSAFRLVLSQATSSATLASNVGFAYILGFRDYDSDVSSLVDAVDASHYATAPSRVDMRGRSYVYLYVGDETSWWSSESARGKQAALGRLQLAVDKGETMYWTSETNYTVEARVQVEALKHVRIRLGRYPLMAAMSDIDRSTMLYDTAGVEHSFSLRVECLTDKTGSGVADMRLRQLPRLPGNSELYDDDVEADEYDGSDRSDGSDGSDEEDSRYGGEAQRLGSRFS